MKKSIACIGTLALLTASFCGGCGGNKYAPAQSPADGTAQPAPAVVSFASAGDPLALGADQQIRASEIQLVEQMVTYRNNYLRELENLGSFYDQQGNQLKAMWVKQEQAALATINMRPYLVVAEIAGADLRATDSIAQADDLYNEAKVLIASARGVFTDRKKLQLARTKLDTLLSTYPSSDKVDDAAWEIAQICDRDMGEYHEAMYYYQRVWQWNPENQYDARFAVARIYDERFRNYPRACEFYELSIQLEPGFTANVTHAKNRIKELNTRK